MTTRRQLDLGDGTHTPGGAKSRPAWMRVLALLCLALVAVMSTAQVCHVHGIASAAKQGPGSHQGDPATGDHCPLCVAMHSAMPADIQVAPEPVVAVRTLESVAADAERMFRWRFEMASRPPPMTRTFA